MFKEPTPIEKGLMNCAEQITGLFCVATEDEQPTFACVLTQSNDTTSPDQLVDFVRDNPLPEGKRWFLSNHFYQEDYPRTVLHTAHIGKQTLHTGAGVGSHGIGAAGGFG